MIFGIAPSGSCTKDDRREDFTQLRRSRRRVVTEGDRRETFVTTNRYCRWLGNRIPSARNRCPIEIQKMKITTKSQIEILLPEPKPNKVANAHCYYVRPTIGNTHVGRSLLFKMLFQNFHQGFSC